MKSTLHLPSHKAKKSCIHRFPAGPLLTAGLPSLTPYCVRRGSMYSIHRSKPSCAVIFDWPGCSGLQNSISVLGCERKSWNTRIERSTHSFIPKTALTLVFSLSFALLSPSPRFVWKSGTLLAPQNSGTHSNSTSFARDPQLPLEVTGHTDQV